MTGAAPKIIREIAKHDFFTNNISFRIDRGQDKNAAAKLLLFEYNNCFKDTTKTILDNFVKETQNENDKVELVGRRVMDTLNDMSSLFLPKDKILTSAGIIPVYYSFIKGCSVSDFSYIREFLVDFEDKRKENKKYIKSDGKNVKLQYVEYDNYNRSTNNQQSHEKRFEILNKEFEVWKNENILQGARVKRRRRITN